MPRDASVWGVLSASRKEYILDYRCKGNGRLMPMCGREDRSRRGWRVMILPHCAGSYRGMAARAWGGVCEGRMERDEGTGVEGAVYDSAS
jgi:hypothetical protein